MAELYSNLVFLTCCTYIEILEIFYSKCQKQFFTADNGFFFLLFNVNVDQIKSTIAQMGIVQMESLPLYHGLNVINPIPHRELDILIITNAKHIIVSHGIIMHEHASLQVEKMSASNICSIITRHHSKWSPIVYWFYRLHIDNFPSYGTPQL